MLLQCTLVLQQWVLVTYMLATLCSKPIAVNAVIGSHIDTNLSVAPVAPAAIQTAIHTSLCVVSDTCNQAQVDK
jgi:hypothetical protein